MDKRPKTSKQDMLNHIKTVWPKIEPILAPIEAERRNHTCIRQRSATYDDARFFIVLLSAAWDGTALRGGSGRGPRGGGLYKRLRLWRDTGNALERAIRIYVESLPPSLLKSWRKRLDAHDVAVRTNAKSHPAGWLMVNRYWHDALVQPFHKVGR